MRAFVLISSAAAALAVAACATPGEPAPPPMADNGNDCAVIAAVAKQHYTFNTTNRLPPPLWLDGEGSGWAPRCDWSRYGLSFPRTFDPNASHQGERVQWVSFKRPRYDGQGATIEAGILHGPLAGMGVECRVVSGFAGWTLAGQCRNTWIS
ncbi:MAG: hypothetical protein EON88_06435 [Brevundimonas sp.]|nr:MAG: hypothetical protein EON88_06435 [Brevundimonas sp.]